MVDDSDGEQTPAKRARTLTFTSQDQRSYIAASWVDNIPLRELYRRLIKIYGRKQALSRRRVQQIYAEFEAGIRVNTERCPGGGRPRSAVNLINDDRLLALMEQRRTWTIEQLVEALNISAGSVSNLLHKHNFRKIGAVWIPHELTCEDIRKRIEAAQTNLNWFRRDATILGRIIAIDETTVRSYDPLDPQMAEEWRRPGEAPYVIFNIINDNILYLGQQE